MPICKAAALALSCVFLADAETCAAGHGTSAEHQAALLQRGVQAGPTTLAHSLERLILPALESHLPITLEQQPASEKQNASDDAKAVPQTDAANVPAPDSKGNASATADATDAKAPDDGAGNKTATGSKTSDEGTGNTSETAGTTDPKAPNDGKGTRREEAGAKDPKASDETDHGDGGRSKAEQTAKDSVDRASGQQSVIPDTSAAAEPAVVGERIAPFGKEDTAQELQDHAARTQDTLVDAIENAEVAEIKRSVFRTLTRLRAASIKEFDTIARMQTEAIDDYNDAHHYRGENPLEHLHSSEPAVMEDKYYAFH